MKQIRVCLLVMLVAVSISSCNSENEGNTSKVVMKDVVVPSGGGDGITFPTGTDDSGTATLTQSFSMSATEATNKLVVEVLQWAYTNNRLSDEVTDHNGVDSNTVKYGGKELIDLDDPACQIAFSSGKFSVKGDYENYPTAWITWYGAVMICNWLTEIEDGNTDNLVYTNITSTWLASTTTTDTTRTGYRIPSKEEWEYAGRWHGTDAGDRTDLVSKSTNGGDPSLDGGYYWTPGLYASGATADYTNAAACQSVAVYDVSGSAEVASKNPNALGLYDMSGNVREWTSALSDSNAPIYSSAWYDDAGDVPVAHNFTNIAPNLEAGFIGFRFCRTL